MINDLRYIFAQNFDATGLSIAKQYDHLHQIGHMQHVHRAIHLPLTQTVTDQLKLVSALLRICHELVLVGCTLLLSLNDIIQIQISALTVKLLNYKLEIDASRAVLNN